MTQPGDTAARLRSQQPHVSAGAAAPHALLTAAGGAFHPSSVSADIGFFSWDIASGSVVCDPVTYGTRGLTEDPAATMDTFLSRVPPADLGPVLSAIRQMTAASGAYQIEYRVAGPDGSLRSMEARGRIVAGPDGRPAQMLGLVMDTTAMRASREVEQRRLVRLADLAGQVRDFIAALASAVTVDAVVQAAREGIGAYGANGFIVVAPAGGGYEVTASCGFAEPALGAMSRVSPRDPTPVSMAIRLCTAVYLGSPRAMADGYPQLVPVTSRSRQRAWVALPVQNPAGRAGACLLGFPDPQEFGAEQRALLFAAAGLLTQSLERARTQEAQQALATELQRGMLPGERLTAPGMTVAARYRPATSGMAIGGDFYDVVHLRGGRSALVIGDVEGHSPLAASLMGQLRTAVRAYAGEGHGPAELLTRTNQWLIDRNAESAESLFATCCLALVDPATGDLSVCRAGHPPPVLAAPGAAPRALDCDAGLPLGVAASADYAALTTRLPAGTTLVLVTDGLLDADGQDEHNLGRVLATLGARMPAEPEQLADDLLRHPPEPAGHADDAALLVARLDAGEHG